MLVNILGCFLIGLLWAATEAQVTRDQQEKRQLAGLLRELRTQGMAVLLVEHDMEVVFRLAHKITVLHRGGVIADEDLERENEEKTSAVHFVRFELTPDMKAALKGGAQMMVGCDHPNYLLHLEELPQETLAALLKDLS